VTPSGELMLVGTENSVSLPLLSVPVDGQKWQTGLFSVHHGRKITPSPVQHCWHLVAPAVLSRRLGMFQIDPQSADLILD